jgi:hypothetical protein
MASKGPKDRTNSNGHDTGTRKGRVSLAAKARELLKEGDLALEFYMKVCEGKIPKILRDDDGNIIGVGHEEEQYVNGVRVGKELPPITTDQRMLAMARVVERGYGQAAQHMHIEAEVRAEVQAIASGVDPRYLAKLSPEALLAIKNAVKALPAPKPKDSKDAEIQDAEFVEVPYEEEEK